MIKFQKTAVTKSAKSTETTKKTSAKAKTSTKTAKENKGKTVNDTQPSKKATTKAQPKASTVSKVGILKLASWIKTRIDLKKARALKFHFRKLELGPGRLILALAYAQYCSYKFDSMSWSLPYLFSSPNNSSFHFSNMYHFQACSLLLFDTPWLFLMYEFPYLLFFFIKIWESLHYRKPREWEAPEIFFHTNYWFVLNWHVHRFSEGLFDEEAVHEDKCLEESPSSHLSLCPYSPHNFSLFTFFVSFLCFSLKYCDLPRFIPFHLLFCTNSTPLPQFSFPFTVHLFYPTSPPMSHSYSIYGA